MNLTAKIFMSLDGVYQGGGGPDEDRRGGFDRGGWQASHADEELGAFIASAYENADAMLLGRVTWEIWEGVLAAPRRQPDRPPHQPRAQVRALDHAHGLDVAEHALPQR